MIVTRNVQTILYHALAIFHQARWRPELPRPNVEPILTETSLHLVEFLLPDNQDYVGAKSLSPKWSMFVDLQSPRHEIKMRPSEKALINFKTMRLSEIEGFVFDIYEMHV
jgi:hypothetical protein